MKYMLKILRRTIMMIMAIALFVPTSTVIASKAPYTTITIDKDGNYVNTQDGYIPHRVMDKFGEEKLKNPMDLFISSNGKLYIADTGNKRVIVCDENGEILHIITEGLKGPTGIYVNNEREIYVADPKSKKIIVYGEDGTLIKEYEEPVSPLFSEGSRYAPSKVVVNNADNIYAISEGNPNGILSFSKQGDFYGYFGANNTATSLTNILRRKLFQESMKSAFQSNIPAQANNVDIDKNGLIYTTTQGAGSSGIKKFNMTGSNMLSGGYVDNLVSDIAVGNIENIYTVTSQGYIYEYTREQEVLFVFGGRDDGKNRTGLFISPSAIDINSKNELFVLDSELGSITVFQPTEYAQMVHTALNLYQEGHYIESREPWENVLRKNGLFDYAHRGIGKAYYRLENYEEALNSSQLGGDYIGYSEAFWELRNDWIRENVGYFFLIIPILIIIKKLLVKGKDKIYGVRRITKLVRIIKNKSLSKELSYLKYMIKNPADSFYGIKFERKVSILSSTLIYLCIYGIYILNKYYSGFLFRTMEEGKYELGIDAIIVFGVIILGIICNNLICSIRDGEGSFRTIYCSFAYCFMPYIFLKPLVIILSQVLTYNEKFIISFLNFIIYAGVIIFIVLMIKEIQVYSYKETFYNIFLTLVTMLIVIAAGVILFALIKQVMDFIVSIFKEGYYRGQ